jgi:hypothetical protein
MKITENAWLKKNVKIRGVKIASVKFRSLLGNYI